MTDTTIEGKPAEVAADLWMMYIAPVLLAAQDKPAEEIALFYSGIIMAAFGSMTADFGHDQAVWMAENLTAILKQNKPPSL